MTSAGDPVATAPAVERPLTEREDEVLRLVASGLGSADVATRLGVRRTTVEAHVRSARTKLGARTRLAASARADGALPKPAGLPITAEQHLLLEHLAAGATLDEAAAHANLSRRTATRRLADVRAALGVGTNVEAVAAVRCHARGEGGPV